MIQAQVVGVRAGGSGGCVSPSKCMSKSVVHKQQGGDNDKHKGTFVQKMHNNRKCCTKVFGEMHKSLRND